MIFQNSYTRFRLHSQVKFISTFFIINKNVYFKNKFFCSSKYIFGSILEFLGYFCIFFSGFLCIFLVIKILTLVTIYNYFVMYWFSFVTRFYQLFYWSMEEHIKQVQLYTTYSQLAI